MVGTGIQARSTGPRQAEEPRAARRRAGADIPAGVRHSARVPDYRRTLAGRRQSWFGLKRHVKQVLALPGVHLLLRAAARLRPSLPIGRLPAPASLREVVGRAGGAEFVLLRPDRCEIAKELYWGGGRRPKPEDALALDVVVALSRRADVMLDVGAYTGVFTVATTAGNPRLRAHAFEIVPAVAEALRANVERNGVGDRVTVHEQGVGDPATTMVVPDGRGGSALPSFYSASMQFESGTPVTFVALDDVGRALPDAATVVMKIDVEGAEAQVLGHGQELLARHSPDILCEVLPAADGAALERLLAPHGYRYLLVRGGDLEPRGAIEPHPHYRDWLLTVRADAELARLGVPVAAG